MIDRHSIQRFAYATVRRQRRSGAFDWPASNPDENNCKPKNATPKLSTAQYIFDAVATKIAKGHYRQRGLIGWMSTGSGKTAVAAGIARSYHRHFTRLPKKVFYISRHDALKPPAEFVKVLRDVFRVGDVELAAIMNKFSILSIASFSNQVAKNRIALSRAVVIIDEAQYLFAKRAVPHLKARHSALISQLLNSTEHHTYILTATPGDSLAEVTTLLNIIRRPDEALATERTLAHHLKGKVVHVDMSNDLSRFPKVAYASHSVHMSDAQRERYLQKAREIGRRKRGVPEMKTLQRWSNGLYASRYGDAKIRALVKNITSARSEKHYVYSQYYRQGLRYVENELLRAGYTRATTKNLSGPGRRYILAKASEKFVPSDDKNPLLDAYNSASNKDGQLIHVMLATDSYNTGLDLKGVNHIHFVEPPLNLVDFVQGVGRGARMCSHRHLPKSRWTVNVHVYASTISPELGTTDARLLAISKAASAKLKRANAKRVARLGNTMKLMREPTIDTLTHSALREELREYNDDMAVLKRYSIDCKVLYYFHGHSKRGIACSEGNPTRSAFSRDSWK